MGRKEIVAVIAIGAAVLLVSILPYLYGYHITPIGKEYMGIHGINEYDTYTYLSWIEQAREGHFYFKNLYTAEAQLALLVNPVFFITGFLASFSNLSNIVVYHIARIVVSAAFLFLLYLFISVFIKRPAHRILAFVVVTTSSGLGILFGGSSTDLWMTETITFLNIYESVLNTFSLALVLGVFLLVIYKFQNKSLLPVAAAAICMNLLTLTHTYDFILVIGIVGLYCLIKALLEKDTAYIRNVLYLLLFSFPAILWQGYVLEKNSSFALWATLQSSVPAYAPVYYLMGYGFLVIFAIVGVVYAWRRKVSKYSFLYIWVAVSVILMYLPFLERFQRKFSEGLHIPIAILASLGIIWWVNYLGESRRKTKILLSGLIVLYLSLTNFKVVYRDLRLFKTGERMYYMNQTELSAVRWLKYNSPPDSVILAANQMGNIIPGISGRTVYIGYNTITSHYDQKYETLKKMLQRPDLKPAMFSSFLRTNGIDYILIDSQMREINAVNFDSYPFLNTVYEQEQVKIYKVNL